MTRTKKIEAVEKLVNRKWSNDYTACINYTGNKTVGGFGNFDGTKEFFFHWNQTGPNGYFLYQGCDLVIGDTTLKKCIKAMLLICNEY